MEQHIYNHLISTNSLKVGEFERWVVANEFDLEFLAQRPLVRENAEVLTDCRSEDSDCRAVASRLLTDHLLPALSEKNSLTDLSLLRAEDGLVVISTDHDQVGEYHKSETYFLEGLKHTYTDDVIYSLSHGEAVMHVSTPEFDPEGKLVAVLVARANLAEMSSIIAYENNLSASEDTYLVNQFNFFVTEPRFGQDYALKEVIHTKGVDSCLEGNSNVGFYNDYRNVPVIGAYQWLPKRNLCILTEVDQEEAFAPIFALRSRMLIIAAGVALVAALLGVIIARSISEPVRKLVEGAEEIGRGNLNNKLEEYGQDEISQLSAAFNMMTANLRQSIGETTHSRKTVIALDQAAQAVQRARTIEDVYSTISNELTGLGYHAIIFNLDESGSYLQVAYLSIESGLLRAGEKIAGISAKDYRQEIGPGNICDQVLRERQTIFVENMVDRMSNALPKLARPAVMKIVNIIGFERAIYAPLIVGDETFGLLIVASNKLSEADISTISAFANQAAIALENAQLFHQVKHHSEELEQRVADRTSELEASQVAALNMMEDANEARNKAEAAQEQINRTALALARSNEELERFAYVASHDLQEPLRMVTSYLKLLEQRYKNKLGGDALEFINYAVDGADRMQTLIIDLLAYSRVDTQGKEFVTTDCEQVLVDVLKAMQVSIDETKARITHDSLPRVLGDAAQLESMFQNLISNAIKFRGKKTPKIHIGVKDENGNWIFSVSDNGIGIDSQYYKRIFIIFQRLHSIEEYSGTGIGLALCKRIVERHGGRMWIDSQEGKGSTFYFSLPKEN